MRKTSCVLGLLFAFAFVACAPIAAQRVAGIDNRAASLQPAFSVHLEREGRLASSLAWRPDGEMLLVGCSNGDVEALNSTLKSQHSMKADSSDVESITWMHNGETFITCGRVIGGRGENSICFWDAANYQQSRTIQISTGPHEISVSKDIRLSYAGFHAGSAMFSADESLLAWSEQEDGTGETRVVILSLKDGVRVSQSGPHGIDFRDVPVFISPDNKHVYWRNMAWDLETKPHLALTNQRKFTLPIFAYSADGRWGYVVEALYAQDLTSQSPMVNIYYPEALYQVDLATGQIATRWEFTVPRRVMHGFSSAVSPNGKLLAIASEWDVHIIDLQANVDLGRCVTTDLASGIRSLSFSPDGKRLAGRTTLGAYVWEVPSTH